MPHKDPVKRKAFMRRYYRLNRERFIADAATRRALKPRTKAERRAEAMAYRYQLTLPRYRDMIISQKDRCAACGEKRTAGRHLDVDHDHVTGKVRGLLCRRCNLLLGLSKDGKLLDAIQRYIRSWK